MKIFLKKHALDFLGNLLMCGPNKIKHWMEKKNISWNTIHLSDTYHEQSGGSLLGSLSNQCSMLDLLLILFTAYSACLVSVIISPDVIFIITKKSFVAHVKSKQFLRSHMYFVGKTWRPTLHCIHPVGGHCYFTGSCNFEPLLSPTFSLLLQNTKKKRLQHSDVSVKLRNHD